MDKGKERRRIEMKISGFVHSSSWACRELERKGLHQSSKEMDGNEKSRILNVSGYNIYLLSEKRG